MPTTVGPDDNADGETEDEDDALAVPGFGSSAPSPFRARARWVVELGRHNG